MVFGYRSFRYFFVALGSVITLAITFATTFAITFATLFFASVFTIPSSFASELSVPKLYEAVPIRIIDGDTFVVRIELWQNIFITPRIRLRGIDAPELPPRSSCAREARAAKRAKERLRILVGTGVILRNISFTEDPYGRTLAEVIIKNSPHPSLNQQLLKEGFVRPYVEDGKEKSYWCS